MNDDAMRLQEAAQAPAPAPGEELARHAETARRLVGAASCSVMLLNSAAPGDLRMRLCASAGALPPGAVGAQVGSGEGICGQVLASGRALLVDDIAASEYASLARRRDPAEPALMSAPLRIDGHIVGVLNASGAGFGQAELRLFEAAALFIGKAVQVVQLRQLLASRFAQMALANEAGIAGTATHYRHPEDVARLLARSFYKEMTRAGFEPAQIVSAATELIAQLGGAIQEARRA